MTKPQQRDHERGQGIVEYALIIALVSVAALAVTAVLGSGVRQSFEDAGCVMERESDGNMTVTGDCVDVAEPDPDTCPDISVNLVRFECRPNTAFHLRVNVENCPDATVTLSGAGADVDVPPYSNSNYNYRRQYGRNNSNADALCESDGAYYGVNNFTLTVDDGDNHTSTYAATISRP